jgi:flagellar export protein FliJ
MKRQPLKLVIEHYRRLRDDSVTVQARVQAELAAAERTLQTLENYRQEQFQRTRDARQDSVSTSQLLLQTRFTGKLDEAIALQQQRIAEIRHRIEGCRSQVLGHQQRLKAIETIEDQRQTRAEDKAARAEQSATDERAAQAHAREANEAAAERGGNRQAHQAHDSTLPH